MTPQKMLHIVQAQLAIDLNCTVADLHGEKDRLVFTEARNNPGRRPFPRGEHHFEMLSMGMTIVVSATPKLLEIIKPQLMETDRDEAFSLPFVYGHSLCYLPDMGHLPVITPPNGFIYERFECNDIPALYQFEGFRNAIQYDVNHPRPDVLIMLAKKDDKIVGMAGASNDCAKMWQVGMDVLPDYRHYGLAAYLVNKLTLEILQCGIVPYYCTASSNIASQRVAHRAGYLPTWVNSYSGHFAGYDVWPTG